MKKRKTYRITGLLRTKLLNILSDVLDYVPVRLQMGARVLEAIEELDKRKPNQQNRRVNEIR